MRPDNKQLIDLITRSNELVYRSIKASARTEFVKELGAIRSRAGSTQSTNQAVLLGAIRGVVKALLEFEKAAPSKSSKLSLVDLWIQCDAAETLLLDNNSTVAARTVDSNIQELLGKLTVEWGKVRELSEIGAVIEFGFSVLRGPEHQAHRQAVSDAISNIP